MIRFLAADLDGTLLTSSKTITPSTQQVLIAAQQRGLTISRSTTATSFPITAASSGIVPKAKPSRSKPFRKISFLNLRKL